MNDISGYDASIKAVNNEPENVVIVTYSNLRAFNYSFEVSISIFKSFQSLSPLLLFF